MLSLLLEPLPACSLTNPGPPAQGQHRPQWAGTTYHINQKKKKKSTTGLPAVQTGGGIPQLRFSFPMALACIKLAKANWRRAGAGVVPTTDPYSFPLKLGWGGKLLKAHPYGEGRAAILLR